MRGYTLLPETARRVKALVYSGGTTSITPIVPVLQGSVQAGVERAWQQWAVAENPAADPPVVAGVNVSGGPIVWEPGVVDTEWQTYTLMASGTPYSVAFPAAAENRWLYVQADLTTRAVTVAFMTTTAFPAHDLIGSNVIFRFPLSLWARTAAGTGSKIYDFPEMPRIPGYARP